jgi:hypothetical protein
MRVFNLTYCLSAIKLRVGEEENFAKSIDEAKFRLHRVGFKTVRFLVAETPASPQTRMTQIQHSKKISIRNGLMIQLYI